MSGTDLQIQFHFAIDASPTAIERVLFQLHGIFSGMEASSQFRSQERFNLFFSFKLADVDTRYVNLERPFLAVVRCLSEVKWLVIGSPYSVMIFSDHIALRDIFIKGDCKKARINRWLDRLGEFDLKLVYRPSTDQHIGIADGLSRMPTRYLTIVSDRLGEKLSMATLHAQSHPLQILENIPQLSRHQKYKESPLYANVINYLEKAYWI